MSQSECVECGGGVSLSADVVAGEIVPCGDCGAELEVTAVSPLTLAAAPREMEDWGE